MFGRGMVVVMAHSMKTIAASAYIFEPFESLVRFRVDMKLKV
jgi:hypothetical protein